MKKPKTTPISLTDDFSLPFSSESHFPMDGLKIDEHNYLSQLLTSSVHLVMSCLNTAYGADKHVGIAAIPLGHNRVQVAIEPSPTDDGKISPKGPTAIRNFMADLQKFKAKPQSEIYRNTPASIQGGPMALISYDVTEMASVLYDMADQTGNDQLINEAITFYSAWMKWEHRNEPFFNI